MQHPPPLPTVQEHRQTIPIVVHIPIAHEPIPQTPSPSTSQPALPLQSLSPCPPLVFWHLLVLLGILPGCQEHQSFPRHHLPVVRKTSHSIPSHSFVSLLSPRHDPVSPPQS